MRERGPQKSILAERSFPPLPSEAAAGSELAPLARTLLERAAQVGSLRLVFPSGGAHCEGGHAAGTCLGRQPMCCGPPLAQTCMFLS